MKSGTIRLYDNSGEVVNQKKYWSKSERIKIGDYWKRIYGKGFDKMYITYDPELYRKPDKRTAPKLTNHKRDRKVNSFI